jgi:hypothetical protein
MYNTCCCARAESLHTPSQWQWYTLGLTNHPSTLAKLQELCSKYQSKRAPKTKTGTAATCSLDKSTHPPTQAIHTVLCLEAGTRETCLVHKHKLHWFVITGITTPNSIVLGN